MGTHNLRGILLRLQDRLSDEDRRRLHFYLSDDIPRRISEDPTLAGTLSLMESLFDQAKINENDCNFLINAFDQIRCHDAAKFLREYRNGLRGTDLNGSMLSLSSILQTRFETEDRPTFRGGAQSAETLILEKRTTCSSVSKQLPWFNPRETVPRIVLMIFLVLVGLLVFSVVFCLVEWKKIGQLNLDLDQERLRTIDFKGKWQDLQVESQERIRQLNEELINKNDERNPLIKYGKKFGVYLGYSFDDSDGPDFKHGHYFSGLSIGKVTDDLETYEFRYTSDLSSIPIRSIFHGEEMVPMRSPFDFQHRDRITQVQGFLTKEKIHLGNGTISSIAVVTGLRFGSMDGMRSLSFDGLKQGVQFSENFTGYTLGYIKGRAEQYLHQIQFVWYRTD